MSKLLVILLVVLPCFCIAQGITYFEKGKKHYDNNEYREALYCFNKTAKLDTSNAELFKLRCNCFYELNVLDSAESDYKKVLSMSDSFPEVYYNLGNLFTVKNDFVNAEGYFRTFLKINPGDGDGLYQLSSILKRTKPDSAFYFLSRAWATDTLNQYFYNTVAWELFEKNELTKARMMAQKGRTKFPYTNELLPLEAYASFAMGDFKEAIAVADSLIQRQSDEISWHILKLKGEILLNTPTEKYSQTRFEFNLKEYSDDFAKLDAWVTDAHHPYFYPTLREKFQANIDSMSLSDFFFVYYGFTTDEKYSPYGMGASALDKTITDQTSDEEQLEIYRKILEQDPFHINSYEALASVAFRLKKIDLFHAALKRYLGLMESILATGNGNIDSAYFVITTKDEYNLLSYLGLRSRSQALKHIKGHSYDMLSAEDENGTKRDVYFNIDKPWRSLTKAFGSTQKTADKKSKGEKKKKRRKQD